MRFSAIATSLVLGAGLILGACSSSSGSDQSSSSSEVSTVILLTDAPSDDLSALQVEITRITMTRTNGNVEVAFDAGASAGSVVNLLQLQGVNSLLATASLPRGRYTDMSMTFRNASAMDINGNALTVSPSGSTTLAIDLVPNANITGQSSYIQIDFDVRNSVQAVTPGVGGSVTISPLVYASQSLPGNAAPVREAKGVVASVSETELTLQKGAGTMLIQLKSTTMIESGAGNFSQPLDLTSHFNVGDDIEVRGGFDPQSRVILADTIELWGRQGGGSTGGTNAAGEVTGLVTATTASTVSLLVLESRATGVSVGSTAIFDVGTSTTILVGNTLQTKALADLSIGQEVRAFAATLSPLAASRLVLRETKLRGTLQSVDTNANTAVLDIARVEKISDTALTGLTDPITLNFNGTLPAGFVANAMVEVEGIFDAPAAMSFSVREFEVENENESAEVEGTTFDVVSTSPFELEITGEAEIPGVSPTATITVRVTTSTLIVERNKATNATTPITLAELTSGVSGIRYGELKAEGTWNPQTMELTASLIRADVGAETNEDELEGTSYSVTLTSPLTFTLTGAGTLDGSAVTNTTITVVTTSNTTALLRSTGSSNYNTSTLSAIQPGLSNNTYSEVKVEGDYDSTTSTLTARVIRVREQ